jgi:hypothetical protein
MSFEFQYLGEIDSILKKELMVFITVGEQVGAFEDKNQRSNCLFSAEGHSCLLQRILYIKLSRA